MNSSGTRPASRNFNKFAYILFTVAGIGFAFLKDLSQAFMFWALALAFDPFNLNTPFQQRPRYQRWWLLVHTGMALAALVLLFFIGKK